MSSKLFLRVEWNETFRTRRDPFAHKKFSDLSQEILVEWMAPLITLFEIPVRTNYFYEKPTVVFSFFANEDDRRTRSKWAFEGDLEPEIDTSVYEVNKVFAEAVFGQDRN